MRPRFDYGDEVRVRRNVRNDGTFPGAEVGRLLVRRGSTGFVRDLGTFLQDQVIYSVHFLAEDRLVGCREEGSPARHGSLGPQPIRVPGSGQGTAAPGVRGADPGGAG